MFLYLAVIALFILMTGYRLFAEGMFVDGVTYAAISRNLARGLGSFWEPHLSATLYPQFHEHPPLAFGLEGLVFRIFGDHWLVERFYSLISILLTGYLMVLIWKELTGEKKSGWMPLFLWVLFPLVSWAASSNLLDNTLCVFTTMSIWLIIKSSAQNRPYYLIIAGSALFAGLLTKGPFALFPWVLPFVWELTRPGFRLGKALLKTLILIIATLAPLILLLVVSNPARSSLHAYWVNQVVGSIENVQTVSSRFYILGILALQLALPLLASGVAIWIFRKKTDRTNSVRSEPISDRREPISEAIAGPIILNHLKSSAGLFLLGLCGVLPIMISMKQSSFYILSALPVFALSMALAIRTLINDPVSQIPGSGKAAGIFRWATILLLAASLVLAPVLGHQNKRDSLELAMIHEFSKVIPRGSTIRINRSLFTEWSLHSYFVRLYGISLDPAENPSAGYWLVADPEKPTGNQNTPWTEICKTNGFSLFEK
ncbi:MAG: glycosyltransferase family 39 protein [Bacteroidales bacterium]